MAASTPLHSLPAPSEALARPINHQLSTIHFLLLFASLALAGCKTEDPHFTGRFDGTLAPAPPPPAAQLSPVNLTNRIDPGWLRPGDDLFRLGPGDKLELEVLGEPTSRITTVVAPDGKIYYNLLPGIDVWGLTLAQARQQLEQGLAKFVREQPQVSVVLRTVESKKVWVLGRVQAPGVYSLAGPTTLLEAISLAGGTLSLSQFQQQAAGGVSDELADLNRSFILRDGKMLPINFERLLHRGDLSQNIYVQPGDFIYFPATSAKQIFVLGAVAQPRGVPFKRGMTVAAAISSAYGTIAGAYMYHVVVIRGSLTEPQMAVVNYRGVLKGEAKDLELEPGDIVYVPFAPYRYLIKYAQLALDTFVSSVAINAGVRAVGPTTTTGATGVFIPVGSGIQVIPPVAPPPIR